MTWYFDPDDETFDLYDHTGEMVREGHEFAGGWTGDYPDDVEAIMAQAARENSNVGNGNAPIATEYAVLTMLDYMEGSIEQGVPE